MRSQLAVKGTDFHERRLGKGYWATRGLPTRGLDKSWIPTLWTYRIISLIYV